MSRDQRKPKKDRTSLVISAVLHGAIIGGILIWAWKTGKIEEITNKILQVVTDDKKKPEKKPEPVQQKQQAQAPKLPPINQGAQSSANRGSRMAVASDAPQAEGNSFFQDTREQTSGPSTSGGRGSETNRIAIKSTVPTAQKTLKPSVFASPPPTTIKALLQERAKASGQVESFGGEQISKSTVSDAADIVGKISGATVVDGKFAVIRGLADRYTSTTFNGIDFPSADPDRRAAQLDLIPAQFISRVDVNKTFSPDLPGGFVGGAIDIVTKSFPEKPTVSFSLGSSYNTAASLRDDFPTSHQSSTDFLAMDDGLRALPADVAATDPRGNSILPASTYGSFGSRQISSAAGSSPLNQSYALALGDTFYLFGKRFGYMAGLNYKSDYSLYTDGNLKKVDSQGGLVTLAESTDTKSSIENMLSALSSFSLELAPDHQLNFTYMYVQSSEDEVRETAGFNENALGVSQADNPDARLFQNTLRWTERSLDYFQLKGGHQFPDVRDAQLDWAAGMATASQDEPDFRMFQYADYGPGSAPFRYYTDVQSQPNRPLRFWREVLEENNSLRADLTIPLPSYNAKENKFKTGFWTSSSERKFNSRILQFYNTLQHPFTTTGDVASYLAPQNQQYLIYRNSPSGNWVYQGSQEITAHYFMGDIAALEWLRVVGGVRFEGTKMDISARDLTTGSTANSPGIDQMDPLPALGVTVSLSENLQLRLAYSETVARPAYREMGRADIIDVAENKVYSGNPNLKMASAKNLDARLEWYPRPGEIVSLSVFQKEIAQPIEQYSPNPSAISYRNSPDADVLGAEFEWRMNLDLISQHLRDFTLGMNATYIKSTVPISEVEQINRSGIFQDFSTERPLYDQPEYLFNSDVTWEGRSSGTMINVSFGVVGRRLDVAGVSAPDEFIEPAPQLDISLSQKFGRIWRLKASAKNLLNPKYETTQEYPGNEASVIKSYSKGMTFGISLSCEF